MREQRFIPVVPASDSAIQARLKRELEGEVMFDAFSRGRYATDASIYQIMPIGVVVPRTVDDVRAAIQIAAEARVPILPRGGGTSQCGQTIGEALVIDNSKYLNKVLDLDLTARRVTVEPGIVLDQLNKSLRPRGLFFPIDPSTASRATIGGMAGNNSCGARSIRYGNMVHNVHAIEAILASGEAMRFSEVPADLEAFSGPAAYVALVKKLRALHARETEEIAARFPKLLRRVAGYNIDMVSPSGHNMAAMLVGSEGTLAYFTEVELDLQPIPRHKTLGVCHFPRFHDAMNCTRHIVKLDPAAVELVDRTMINLAREIPQFRATVDRFLKGEPDALLLVEFAGEDKNEQVKKLKELDALMGDLGFADSVVDIIDPGFQKDTWEVRKSGLNIMMSMKGDGKPVSFIEDCAVPLEDLAEYTDRLTRVFEKHGTKGTWYAHASVGCLHVRPVLNMKTEEGAKKMRAIAEEACAMVREYKGAYSGEHGDGIVRSEWIEPMLGPRIVRALEEVKNMFDPNGLFNPGKIVRAPRMDDRALFRFKPDYQVQRIETALDWSAWGGFGAAVEMCNNNGACRKFEPGTMCPSYRATRDEQHLTRGRANSLRLALSGQLGPDAFTSDAMYETLDLCVSCKVCKRECPTGVDIAKMKIEFLYHYRKRHPLSPKEKLIAYLPRYAPRASRFAFLLNARNAVPGLASLGEKWLDLSAKRSLPKWRGDAFNEKTSPPLRRGSWEGGAPSVGDGAREVVLLIDTFNRYFEPENARAALSVLRAAGYTVHFPAMNGERPLCCGRTFLACGLVDEAKIEAHRMLSSLKPYVERGVAVVGIEPSCLFTLRDEFGSMLPGAETEALAARALLFEEFLAQEHEAHRLNLKLKPLHEKKALLHGHCHQKAFAVMPKVEKTLSLVPQLAVETIDSSCCGMAGAFGFEASHYEVSM
ncbi:MAG TPA: FAD-linked oxidase C-terminal domain-containing protein, partial [Burkholderiales bacterium]|nr:FAD-linked oxidase C-terminal domain-containing protein [Burkholderiales bacterium]